MAKMKCPFCQTPIGVEENPFDFDTVSYYEDVKGKKKLRLEFIVVFCTKCNSVIGVTR